jgi:hypothetical protein
VDGEAEDAPPEAPEEATDDVDDDGEAELLAAMALSLEVSHILSPVHVSNEPQYRVGGECVLCCVTLIIINLVRIVLCETLG